MTLYTKLNSTCAYFALSFTQKSNMASSNSCRKSTSKDRKDFRNKKFEYSDKETSKELPVTHNVFANDGSFFEMFQKMKEMEQAKGEDKSGLSDKNLKQGEKDNTRTNQTDDEISDDSKPGTSSLSLQVWFIQVTGLEYLSINSLKRFQMIVELVLMSLTLYMYL